MVCHLYTIIYVEEMNHRALENQRRERDRNEKNTCKKNSLPTALAGHTKPAQKFIEYTVQYSISSAEARAVCVLAGEAQVDTPGLAEPRLVRRRLRAEAPPLRRRGQAQHEGDDVA